MEKPEDCVEFSWREFLEECHISKWWVGKFGGPCV